jgi:hypothetical protein
MTQEQVEAIVAASRPARLSDAGRRPIPEDHVAHIVQLVGWGHALLAADHLLFPEITGRLPAVTGGVIRQLGMDFVASRPRPTDDPVELEGKVRRRQFAYEALLEIAINFFGLESRWLDAEEKRQAVEQIRAALAEWEEREQAEGSVSVAQAVVRHTLGRMRLVQGGTGMVAQAAARIEQALEGRRPVLPAYLEAAAAEIEGNIYARMVREGVCRFGNDYALGLRWLRHLGFEQVSTNPVLAALAYKDDPALGRLFQEEVRHHPRFGQWARAPQQFADQIALYATLLALWDNLHVYRPIFFNLAAESGGGVVSFQLNPRVAHLVQESIQDVFTAFAAATEDLRVYDDYLLAGYPATRERARPNMVIKVAASSPAAREIARTINRLGIGSNITLSYSAAQEVTMALEELAGMAGAVKMGIVPTQVYVTNMGGRLESHLREVKLEELFALLRAHLGEARALDRVRTLAAANGSTARVEQAEGYEAKVVAATRYAHQRRIDSHVAEALREVASAEELQRWEEAIGRAGTLVARRVWGIFFSPENREKWLAYLCRTYQLTREQAELVFSRICYLPASKRKPEDTYWALAGRNLVHTEFPNHQENVRRMATSETFRLADYRESIGAEFPPEVLARLQTMADFRTAYELTPELNEILREVGIAGDFGTGGHLPEQWPEFGPVRKTLAEFTEAYEAFRAEMLRLFQEVLPAAVRAATRGRRRAALSRARSSRTSR